MELTTKGIILKEVKTTHSKKLLTILTEKEGKILVSYRNSNNKMYPVMVSLVANFNLQKTKQYYNFRSYDLIVDTYKIAPNYGKYSLVLENIKLVNKIIPENAISKELFSLTGNYLFLSVAKEDFLKLSLAFKVKLINLEGVFNNDISSILNKKQLQIVNQFNETSFEKFENIEIENDMAKELDFMLNKVIADFVIS